MIKELKRKSKAQESHNSFGGTTLISVLGFGNVNRDLDSTVQNAEELQVADGGFWSLCSILFVAEKNA
jgi:hypothetical protein